MKKQVLIIYPVSTFEKLGDSVEFQENKNVPLGILSIGAILERERFIVKIIDARLYSKKEVLRLINCEIKKSLCIGISVTTPQIKHALQICNFIKRNNKEIPIVWGGIHPSLYSLETIEDKNVDFVITGEAEFAFLDLVKCFSKKSNNFKEINGLYYKKNGKIIFNGASPPIDPNELPLPAYHLIDIEKYIIREFRTYSGVIKKMRALDIYTSRGCPYKCTFCITALSGLKKWRPINTDKVLSQIDYLVKKYDLDFLFFIDDFFFGDKKRIVKIAKHLLKKKYNVMWDANVRVNLFNKHQIDDKFLCLLKKSGCFTLRMGIESGSDRILKFIKKGITVKQIIYAVSQCQKHGILVFSGFMFGFPSETKEEIKKTTNLILRLYEISPNSMLCVPDILRPYPSTEIYQECVKKGFKTPRTLRDWANEKADIGSYTSIKRMTWIKDPTWLLNVKIFFFILLVYRCHKINQKDISITWKILGNVAEFWYKYDLKIFKIFSILWINYLNFSRKFPICRFSKKTGLLRIKESQ